MEDLLENGHHKHSAALVLLPVVSLIKFPEGNGGGGGGGGVLCEGVIHLPGLTPTPPTPRPHPLQGVDTMLITWVYTPLTPHYVTFHMYSGISPSPPYTLYTIHNPSLSEMKETQCHGLTIGVLGPGVGYIRLGGQSNREGQVVKGWKVINSHYKSPKDHYEGQKGLSHWGGAFRTGLTKWSALILFKWEISQNFYLKCLSKTHYTL